MQGTDKAGSRRDGCPHDGDEEPAVHDFLSSQPNFLRPFDAGGDYTHDSHGDDRDLQQHHCFRNALQFDAALHADVPPDGAAGSATTGPPSALQMMRMLGGFQIW